MEVEPGRQKTVRKSPGRATGLAESVFFKVYRSPVGAAHTCVCVCTRVCACACVCTRKSASLYGMATHERRLCEQIPMPFAQITHAAHANLVRLCVPPHTHAYTHIRIHTRTCRLGTISSLHFPYQSPSPLRTPTVPPPQSMAVLGIFAHNPGHIPPGWVLYDILI